MILRPRRQRERCTRSFGDVPYREGDYIVIPRGTTYQLRAVRPAALPPLRDARPDRDPEALPQPVRPADRARALLPPRHPSADGAQDAIVTATITAEAAGSRRLPGRTTSTTTRSTSSGGMATSIRGRSTSTTSSRSRGGSICRRRHIRRSRAGTSSSARSARASSTSIRWRFRFRTTTRTSRRGGDDLLRLRQLRLAPGNRGRLGDAASRRAFRTDRTPASRRSRSGRRRRTSWRSCATRSTR